MIYILSIYIIYIMETNNKTNEQKKGRLDYLSAQLPIITRDKGYAISEGMVEDVSLCNEQIRHMKKEKKRLSVYLNL